MEVKELIAEYVQEISDLQTKIHFLEGDLKREKEKVGEFEKKYDTYSKQLGNLREENKSLYDDLEKALINGGETMKKVIKDALTNPDVLQESVIENNLSIKQKDVAELTGIDSALVSRCFNGKVSLAGRRADIAIALLEAYKVI